MGLEDLGEGEVPFTGQRFSIFNPTGAVGVIVTLALGFMALNGGEAIGQKLWQMVARMISNLTNTDLTTDGSGTTVEVV